MKPMAQPPTDRHQLWTAWPEQIARVKMSTEARYTAVIAATDVTKEILDLVRDIGSGSPVDRPVDWESVWERLEAARLDDGTMVDMGGEIDTPAMRKIQEIIDAEREPEMSQSTRDPSITSLLADVLTAGDDVTYLFLDKRYHGTLVLDKIGLRSSTRATDGRQIWVTIDAGADATLAPGISDVSFDLPPTPEPTGLGAVVQGTDGVRLTRWTTRPHYLWHWITQGESLRRWSDIPQPVTVIAKGVEEEAP